MNKTVLLCSMPAIVLPLTAGCNRPYRNSQTCEPATVRPPAPARPISEHGLASSRAGSAHTGEIDLTEPGAAVWGTAAAEIIDTAMLDPQILPERPGSRDLRRVKEILPTHHRSGVLPIGPPNDLPVGGMLAEPRARAGRLFPGIGQTAWVPPDPTLAVGPEHIVTTVNMSIAFYSRDGEEEFYNYLGEDGDPGFFEPVGAGGFTFDPKCCYDHLAERFVVLALEVYDDDEAWITIAVSDDSDPHGTWYKYRTDAVITVGSTTFWWDYPGLGYDADGYYVNANLFGLNQSGWAGVGFRVFDKSSMLAGDPVQYATLRDSGAASVQAVQHFGANAAPLFVSLASSSALRIHAITDPLTDPQLTSTTVSVPSFNGPSDAPAAGGYSVQLIDNRIMNAHWRDGNLYVAHHISQGSRNLARWYHVDTGDWPADGSVTFVQSGNIDAGSEMHTWFPAIYSNQSDEVALVFGASSDDERISLNVTGRLPGDPAGTMGAIEQILVASVDGGGRWGDYYDVAVDPLDDTLFWIIGEYPESYGWATWISSFSISEQPAPHALPDDAGAVLQGETVTIDVLANDYHSGELEFDISDFDALSVNGGTVELSEGSGPQGRDELSYTAPTDYAGPDSFNYTISDAADESSSAAVTAEVFDPAELRDPDDASGTEPGIDVAYYELSSPSALPDFSTLSPYADESVTQVDYAATEDVFAGSGRSDEVGAVFEGYVVVPAHDVYTFYLESNDGSKLSIGEQTVVDNDGLHDMTEVSGTIGLEQGPHLIRVEFFENDGPAGLIASVAGGGLDKQVIPAEMWVRVSPCPGNFNNDGAVDLIDLAALLANYGMTSGATYQDGDLNADRRVNLADLAIFLGAYGMECE